MTSEAQFKKALRGWLVARARSDVPADFDDNSPLLEQRILTSLQVVDLVVFIEDLTGRAVDVEQLKPGAFRSVNAIYAHFGAG